MESSIFGFIWKYSKRQQLVILALELKDRLGLLPQPGGSKPAAVAPAQRLPA